MFHRKQEGLGSPCHLSAVSRIASGITIHSAPYHFSVADLHFSRAEAEAALPGVYSPASDTMLVLTLRPEFLESQLEQWFARWEDDGLLFLSHVSCFRWCTIAGETLVEKEVTFTAWDTVSFTSNHPAVTNLTTRRVTGRQHSWIVWKATVRVPDSLHPAHKARTDTTDISIALPDTAAQASLYVGFKTLVSVSLPFSLDAQFDPSTARETVIENKWNNWLIERCADIIADVAGGLLATEPIQGWSLIPLNDEKVGKAEDGWLRTKFDAALQSVRQELGAAAALLQDGEKVPLKAIAYEAKTLAGLLDAEQVERLAMGWRALRESVRGADGRWRQALADIGVSTEVGTEALLAGFEAGFFTASSPSWWVDAADCLIRHHAHLGLFGKPFWLREDRRAVSARRKGESARLLVFGGDHTAFAIRWNLHDRLHPAYGANEAGEKSIAWLEKSASFARSLDAASDLAAFAESHRSEPLEISDEDLSDLRDRFDDLDNDTAGKLGQRVGAVLRLDGFAFEAGKSKKRKVSPATAYLCKAIDSDHPNWPVAAGTVPEIEWVAPRYGEKLKTGATRLKRRRPDGVVSRGPRRFLMLLGVEVAPRVQRTAGASWGSAERIKALHAADSEQVEYDYFAPDLDRVLRYLEKAPKKKGRIQSPALIRALSRGWDRYKEKVGVPAQHVARVHTYLRGQVTATWLERLRTSAWVAVTEGKPVQPAVAVIKTIDTSSLYGSFVFGIEPKDVADGLARVLHLIVDVRVGDLVARIREMREEGANIDEGSLQQLYRNIASRCPAPVTWNTRIGEITAIDLRSRFTEGRGLIHVGGGQWRRPEEMLRGNDIFHERERFVPSGTALARLWSALEIREPHLGDCIARCRSLSHRPYQPDMVAVLIDVYRHMNGLLPTDDRRYRDRLKTLPVLCGELWISDRPIFFLEDTELRDELARELSRRAFWTPPCDTRDLARLMSAMGIVSVDPILKVVDARTDARERAEEIRLRFGHAVDHLSGELARNDPTAHGQLTLTWDALKALPLCLYDSQFLVRVVDNRLSSQPIDVAMHAWLGGPSQTLHVTTDGLDRRDYGGRAIASLFAAEVRHKIGGEWVLAWQKSGRTRPQEIRLASDEERQAALEEQAERINSAPKKKITVTPTANRNSVQIFRTLKSSPITVVQATITPGNATRPPPADPRATLSSAPPERSQASDQPPSRIAYTLAELEQRGWEILTNVLNTAENQELVDFRQRHRVGADGAINWKTFVEMKATGRGPQTSVEFSNSEYERAKQRGKDFILALVSGLETGEKEEVRLIFDPAACTTMRPMNGVRLIGLLGAPAVVVELATVHPESPQTGA